MKPEPLTKDKIYFVRFKRISHNSWQFQEGGYIPKLKEKFEFCLPEDVKSAVEWLLKEIEKEIERIEINKSNAPWDYKVANLFSPESEGFVKGLKFAKVIIKKAFEGVIDDA